MSGDFTIKNGAIGHVGVDDASSANVLPDANVTTVGNVGSETGVCLGDVPATDVYASSDERNLKATSVAGDAQQPEQLLFKPGELSLAARASYAAAIDWSQIRGSSLFHKPTALAMRYLSSAVYEPPEQNLALNNLRSAGFEVEILGSEEGSTQAVLASRGAQVFLIFRGTEVDSTADLGNQMELLEPEPHTGVEAHGGVIAGLDEVWPQLTEALERKQTGQRGMRLTISGHSLGGGLANLTALRLEKNDMLAEGDLRLGAVYTFAAMNPGDAAFERAYLTSGLESKTFSLFGTDDPFSHWPPEGLGFRPVGIQIPIEGANHSIDRFGSYLQQQNMKSTPRGGSAHTIHRAAGLIAEMLEQQDATTAAVTDAKALLAGLRSRVRARVLDILRLRFGDLDLAEPSSEET